MTGGCLLLAGALHGRWRWLILPVAAAGSTTLTSYTVHVAVLAAVSSAVSAPELSSPTAFWAVNAISALVLASAWQFTGRRGPLEGIAADECHGAPERDHPSLLPPPVTNRHPTRPRRPGCLESTRDIARPGGLER